MLNGKKIVLGVSGGIAAYKAAALTSKLVQAGAEVKVIMTHSAQKFVAPTTFQALSRQPVYTDTFEEEDSTQIQHIDVADWADLFLIAPATANVIGKLAGGLADDMLSTTLLATEAPVYIAPAMNVHMYKHPAVMKNMKQLDEWGFRFIEPGEGYLACGYVGKGRLEEPETIVEVLQGEEDRPLPLTGRKVLITAGPTREKIDPVRYFTNPSTGRMGYALAQKAQQMGAEVTLVSGKVTLEPPVGVDVIPITTAQEMYEEVMRAYSEQDIVIKSAAVADYRPKVTYEQKMKKTPGEYVVEMERTKDILMELGQRKEHQYLIGFAAETMDMERYGREKLAKKNLDAVVINNVSEEGSGFGTETNASLLITKKGQEMAYPLMSKQELAENILLAAIQEMESENR
ncbi:bifunctional phosphopantothenoylcysteine decarboxylase/phosphopantothenate--cysteine ligase CoaBC [Halobacillus karajensis]|uniref:Coenzyme A biosynthesis bifunctional protein CoaBC n=1 Tax=Halobacillus karajensis TaxID=195088 RepID=A0A024P1U1_9BACI|nr:bifunctional phosphopantothenoylcysteine decarboxylase/phosphopantothenate--cysteine ligase CoaBC [Halobacillus karajensis]CDQ19804.1 DNA/pantothenate metabolism flavoprotein [Halobacillus karajensis]CDQ22264.1 DNA/pantothenate metabolism flavoprotein [Halobacillus karajensis]CDQ28105.1 DNA/pantothenate metabolism flavoprotein [Halobacillus karajensis]